MADFAKIIIFQLNNQEYGTEINQVRSIERFQNLIELPQSPDFIKGIINLRGEIIPIIDLKKRLNIKNTEPTDQTRVLITAVNEVQVGIIVDAATDVIDIDPNVIEPTPKFIGGSDQAKFIKAVAKLNDRLILLSDFNYSLDLETLNEILDVIDDNSMGVKE
ncbi:chemotaxis protein CheW [Aquibacillus saliphilus]|uniref:chemotaxis protein CheW n=1 Tax=Aquibacillus saliphilus TaxID=1909422 RepID=UPI001CF06A28|nr:chemotaxis protein CheW [Aquibacillus saliphilus]